MDPSLFYCPSDVSHVFSNYHDFRQHLIKCRLLQDRTAYVCRYSFKHMFLTSETRDIHENSCPERELEQPRYSLMNTLKLGAKHRDNLLSSKFDENQVFGPSNHSSDARPPSNANYNTESNQNNGNMSHIIERPIENAIIPIILTEQIQIKTERSPSIEVNNFQISDRNNRQQDPSPTPTQYSQKLESLIHTLIVEGDQRLEIIVRRRSNVWKLRMKEFSITEFKPVHAFGHLLNEKLSQEIYENEFFVGEYTLFGTKPEKIQLYSRLLSKFDSGEMIAVNNLYKDSHNEVLLICTNKSKVLGPFLKKGDLSILLFKYTTLYNKVRLFHGENLRSPWVTSLVNTNNGTFDDASSKSPEYEFVKKEKHRLSEDLLSYKREILDGKNKNPFHFYPRELEMLAKEDDRKESSVIDVEIEEMEKKCEEMRNLINKQTEQYKNRLDELESLNQKKKAEIKNYVQMINLFEKNKAETSNDLNNHDLLFKEEKKRFEQKFYEELNKQKAKYLIIYRNRVAAYEAELLEKQKEFPVKEKELDELSRDFELKKGVYDKDQRLFLELKARLTELKKNFEKMAGKQNFLEMHKKFNNNLGGIENSGSFDTEICNFCYKEPRIVVCFPCRHFVGCQSCVDKAKTQGIEFCMVCKGEVKQKKIVNWY